MLIDRIKPDVLTVRYNLLHLPTDETDILAFGVVKALGCSWPWTRVKRYPRRPWA